MVGHGGPVQRLVNPEAHAADFHFRALRKFVRLIRTQRLAAEERVQRIGGVQVLLAEIRFLERIERDIGRRRGRSFGRRLSLHLARVRE